MCEVIEHEQYGKFGDVPVSRFEMKNCLGMSISCINYGATIVSVKVPNKHGVSEEVALCYDNMDDLVQNHGPYYGFVEL
jgi:aldose 1-epimerase